MGRARERERQRERDRERQRERDRETERERQRERERDVRQKINRLPPVCNGYLLLLLICECFYIHIKSYNIINLVKIFIEVKQEQLLSFYRCRYLFLTLRKTHIMFYFISFFVLVLVYTMYLIYLCSETQWCSFSRE